MTKIVFGRDFDRETPLRRPAGDRPPSSAIICPVSAGAAEDELDRVGDFLGVVPRPSGIRLALALELRLGSGAACFVAPGPVPLT